MSITITETFDGREATFGEGGEREYKRTFYAESTTALHGADEVLLSSDLPRRGDIYVSANGLVDYGATVREVRVHQRGEPHYWQVEVTYSSRRLGSKAGDLPEHKDIENPLLRPAEIKWGCNRVNKVCDKDALGAAIVNSAKQPFDPPFEKEEIRLTLSITRNKVAFIPEVISTFVGAVNGPQFAGFAAKRVRCTNITADRQFENGVYFWRITGEFEIKDTWYVSIMDAGFYKLVGGNTLELIRDRFGTPLSKPGLLNGNGDALTPGSAPVFLWFDVFAEVDFNALGLL